jgi:hypothetical protein
MFKHVLWVALLLSSSVFGQNLMEERIWKIAARKKSIFLDAGVFHHGSDTQGASITGVRSSAVDGRGYERVVIDFSTPSVPKLYGHISSTDKKISVDFFNTTVSSTQPQLKQSKHIKNIDFVSVDGKTATMEINLKGKASFDVFYLESPGRLVFDIR